MRRPISSKPGTCTERCDVDLTGISMKVARITLGDLRICPRGLLAPRGGGMDLQESAEVVVVAGDRSDEGPNLSRVDSHACSLRVQGTSLGEAKGHGNRCVETGSLDAVLWCSMNNRRHDERNQARWGRLPSRQEPPYAEPHVRWCGRTAGVTPPPTRLHPEVGRWPVVSARTACTAPPGGERARVAPGPSRSATPSGPRRGRAGSCGARRRGPAHPATG